MIYLVEADSSALPEGLLDRPFTAGGFAAKVVFAAVREAD